MGLLSWLFEPAPVAGPAPAAPQQGQGAGTQPRDTPQALRGHNAEVIAAINRSAGSIPNAAVVLGRAITDAVARILDYPHELSIETRISLHAVLTDYLPTTLKTYLAAQRSGLADEEDLQEQMTLLHTVVTDLLGAVQAHDAQAAAVQGAFLRTKFTGSDLAL